MYEHDEVYLRKLEEGDLPAITGLKRESWLSTHQITIVNSANQKQWLESLDSEDVNAPQNLVMAAGLFVDVGAKKTRGAIFGIYKIFNVDYISRTANVGWDVFENFRGDGRGKNLVKAGAAFCFDILNLHRLDAEILSNNVASLKCAQNAGFSKEGVRRQAVHKLGEYVDSVVFGLLSEERNF